MAAGGLWALSSPGRWFRPVLVGHVVCLARLPARRLCAGVGSWLPRAMGCSGLAGSRCCCFLPSVSSLQPPWVLTWVRWWQGHGDSSPAPLAGAPPWDSVTGAVAPGQRGVCGGSAAQEGACCRCARLPSQEGPDGPWRTCGTEGAWPCQSCGVEWACPGLPPLPRCLLQVPAPLATWELSRAEPKHLRVLQPLLAAGEGPLSHRAGLAGEGRPGQQGSTRVGSSG